MSYRPIRGVGVPPNKRRGSSAARRGFQEEVKKKLASEEWEGLVTMARQRVGLPPSGLSPQDGEKLVLGGVISLMSAYIALNPREDVRAKFAEDIRRAVDQLPEAAEAAIIEDFQVLRLASPQNLIAVRLTAAYLASWLRVEDDGRLFLYLISPGRWPLDNWRPEEEEVESAALGIAMGRLLGALFPSTDDMRRVKWSILRRYVEVNKDDGTWDELTDVWNRLFPFWRFDHWRNMKKDYSYWMRKLVHPNVPSR